MVKKTPKSGARILKDKGLLPSSYRLNKLTSGQKSWVTKQVRKFADVVEHPHRFSTIKTKTKRHREQAENAGFKVGNGRAVIRNDFGEGRLSRAGDKITINDGEVKREIWFANSKTFEATLAKLRREKLGKNQYWSFAIGTNESGQEFASLDDLMAYLRKLKFKTDESIGKWVSLTRITLLDEE